MAYTTINKGSDYFNTVLWTGTGSGQSITGMGFQPDWLWFKQRNGSSEHALFDSIRDVNAGLSSNSDSAENNNANSTQDLVSFDSDGFTTGTPSQYGSLGSSGNTIVTWGWLAQGTSPAKTYKVVVVDDSGNKYRFRNSADDATYAASAVTLDLQEGGVYTFDQSDSSNSGHPFRFSTTSDGTHGGGSEYTTGVVTTGTPGSAGAKTTITVAASAPTLYYYCSVHSGMGGQSNTNSTFGQTNFDGSVLSVSNENTTSGFSVVTYTGTGANATVGHGLGVAPKMVIVKNRDRADSWRVGLTSIGFTKQLILNETDAESTDSAVWQDTAPTSSVFSIGTRNAVNASGEDIVAYCFAAIKGYSKIGSYIGNGSSDGPFVYTGFRPAFLLVKNADVAQGWNIVDTKRDTFNETVKYLTPSNTGAEDTSGSYYGVDLLSNGFKARNTDAFINGSGNQMIYMAFAEHPFVSSGGVPVTAR